MKLANWPACGAGHLPRITEKSFAEGGVATFFAGAAKGTVALAWDGTKARVIDGCHLDGRYVEAMGKGTWRFRATNRVLFRTDEIAGECRTATHIVAAYVAAPGAPSSRATLSQMSGILVPLPCPPATDPEPAPGCIAHGLTGPARRRKAEALMTEIAPGHVAGADPAKVLEVFALIPDKAWGITYATQLNTGDDGLFGQGQWLGSQYTWTSTDDIAEFPGIVKLLDAPRRPPPPQLVWACSDFNYVCRPVFLWCFAGQFEPIISHLGHWTPMEP